MADVDFLTALGLDPALAGALDDDRHYAVLREETELALTRAGSDVGTPVLPGRQARGTQCGHAYQGGRRAG
jgi:hypothetical protein